ATGGRERPVTFDDCSFPSGPPYSLPGRMLCPRRSRTEAGLMNRTLAALMMTAAALSTVLAAAPALAQSAKGPSNVVSPQPLPIDDSRPRVFLGGSIDTGGAPDWQAA